jgi:hypothetical protein
VGYLGFGDLSNPIEIVLRARKRIARLAVIRTGLHAASPLIVTLAIALGLDMLNGLTFDHFGYLMDAGLARRFQMSLLVFALVQLVVVALFAWRSWLHASDFLGAAEQIDRRVGGRQEVVTLATLFDPARPEAGNMRSQLFPVLWARVAAYLEAFDPRWAFTLEVREPLVRSFILGTLAAIVLSTVGFALMTRPTPAQSVTHRLQLIADTIDASAPSQAQQQLAAAARDVARDLVSPKLTPQEKIAELRALEQELGKSQAQRRIAHAGKGNSSGGSSGNGSGGNGSGGGRGAGQGSGSGSGSGNSQTGSGANRGGKASQQIVELHNDIAKAQMKLQQEADSGSKATMAQNHPSKNTGAAPKPGTNPNQPGGQNSSNGSSHLPQPQTLAAANMPSGQSPSAHRNDRGSMGDTHLGEFPKPGNYQRFYKLGEHGPAINIRDARYVTFQLPTEIQSAGTGAIVPDNTRPRATTPYTNAPLKQERLQISPDEQQLVPPRYRELIR